jgi:hypothetical protein
MFHGGTMGIYLFNELTANCLAGGLGGTCERLEKTIWRLSQPWSLDAQEYLDRPLPVCPNSPKAAVVTQDLREKSDVWQNHLYRPLLFIKTERLFETLKDKTLEALDNYLDFWTDYHCLAQYLSDLKLDSSQENLGLHY